MITLYRVRVCSFLLVLLISLFAHGTIQAQSSNGVLREVYLDIGGSAIVDLTSNPKFPNSPSLETIEPIFEAPVDYSESFGQRMRALFTAPQTGQYVFWIASDDQGILYLSTDDTPTKKTQIASVIGWTASREWEKEANQRSAPVTLTSGKKYYIEAISKEGGGGDNLAVRVQLPDNTIEAPIPNNRLHIYGLGPPTIVRHPTNTTVIESVPATFSVTLDRMIGARFQWLRNGVGISGATNPVLTLEAPTLANSGTQFRCTVTNAYGFAISSNALLTVQPDVTPPTLVSVGSLGEPSVIFVVFSENVQAASATNHNNYAISGGATVVRATFGPDGRTIILTTTPLDPNTAYTLTVNNVRDRATTPNVIAANTQRGFSLAPRRVDAALHSLPRETIGPSTRRHGIVISEVMYHPTNRTDGRNLEYVELYNSQPWFQELGGWRISGAIDYTFPSNVVLQARSYLVVAANTVDFRSVYSFTNVHGPFLNTNGLQNSSGTLRIRNKADAVMFEMTYTGDPPYPAAADGGGHSLVLGRPSYGERDPRAWVASDLAGGNPGGPDTPIVHVYRSLLINEVMAHTDPPNFDYIELHNRGTQAVNIGLCFLTDDPSTNKFQIASNTLINPGQFLSFSEQELGFALSAAGETVFLKSPQNNRVIDAVRFPPQENGVPWGRSPDGASEFHRLNSPTPGTPNATRRPHQIVINEILFDPLNSESDMEFVELHNPTGMDISLAGWRLREGITYTFPSNAVLRAGNYLTVARDPVVLRTNYPQLNTSNCWGGYNGSLANGGERIVLTMPDEVASTNTLGNWITNRIHIPVDEVAYGAGGRWSRWAAGGGSSLELRDARADNRLAPNWAASDESNRSGWVVVEATGVMDNGWAEATQLHVTLMGAGEAIVDDVEVIPSGGANLVANGNFNSGTSGWTFQGNHNQSQWTSSGGFGGSGGLHIITQGKGDSGANRIRVQLSSVPAAGTTVTLRCRARWVKGNPNLLLRLRGNWHEAPGVLPTTYAFGTPAAANTRATVNAGPAITDVRHEPALPAGAQPVLVLARVHDPDGLAYLALHYRIDPQNTYRSVAMTNHGSGLFSTSIPAQAGGTTAAFFIQAIDNHPTSAQSSFPDDAPTREAVIRWGDPANPGTLPTYRMWITQTNVTRWSLEEKMSNRPKDVTFIYGNSRVIYNAGAWFHGSPYHSPSYNSPVGNSCDYDLGFPPDDALLGETDINLFRPGNGGGDGTAQAEIHGYWFGEQFGIPYLYHRPVFVLVNGQRRDNVFHDAQQPNGDFIDQWHPDDADGDLHKIMLGFEFGDMATGANEAGYSVIGSSFSRVTTTGGAWKQAWYRSVLPLRSASPSQQNNYTNLFNMIQRTLTPSPIGSEQYTATLSATFDVEEWFKVHVTQHLYNNPDSFSYGGGQNAFTYKPDRDGWKLYLWDIDFAFGGDPNDGNLFGIGGADHGPRNDHPPFARYYWQALIEAANGFMTASRSTPILYSRYNGMTAGGAAVADPGGITNFIAIKRNVILNQLAANQYPFAITSHAASDFSTNRNLITLSGTAPLQARSILINGIAYPVTWTTVSNWILRVPLSAGLNTLNLTAVDSKGVTVPGVSRVLRITYTGTDEQPEQRIVINEIMYHPPSADAAFIELHNTSASNAFDLSGWRLQGAGLDFPQGTLIEPGAFLLAAKDRTVFGNTYGVLIPVAAEFDGQLDNGGETLTLIRPGATSAQDKVIDRVTYDDDAPWPSAADGLGASLQLTDPLQDNNRASNWRALRPDLVLPPQGLIVMTNLWKFNQSNDLSAVNWTAPNYNDAQWQSGRGLLYVEPAPLPHPKNTPLTLGRNTYYFRTKFNHVGNPAGASLSLQTVIDDGAVFYLNGKLLFALGVDTTALSYATPANRGIGDAAIEGPFILPGNDLQEGENVLAVEVHQSAPGSSDIVFGISLETTYASLSLATPGAANSVRAAQPAYPALWINEILPSNIAQSPNSLTDRFGERDPWLELYNGGSTNIPLSGYWLSSSYSNLNEWPFPAGASIAPGQLLLVWLDAQPGQSIVSELHASFKPQPSLGAIALTRGTGSSAQLIDHLNYQITAAGRSFGSYPEGNASQRRSFLIPTPRATNNPASPPVTLFINEWMADNTRTLADPVDGQLDDWFEIYNPGQDAVDIGDYYLSDTLSNSNHWKIPDGTRVPGRGYLLVWADNEPSQNDPAQPDLHAGFSLSRSGESIALFSPDGVLVDGVTFLAQTADVSQGRFPDGSASIVFMTNSTPRSANRVAQANLPPVLAAIGNRSVAEGNTLNIQCAATDPNTPAQELTFTLDAPIPPGASIHPNTGRLLWTPTEAQGPGVYPLTIRVTDNGSPNLSDSETVSITVLEVNNPPVLTPPGSKTVEEGVRVTSASVATDPDGPSTVLRYSLEPGFPPGAAIDAATGLFSWTPTEAQGPGVYSIGIRVTDNGDPELSDIKILTVFVNEVNSAPTLLVPGSQSVHPGAELVFQISATDGDLPAQGIQYSLGVDAPVGASVDVNTGRFSWSVPGQASGLYELTFKAEDTGSPRLSDSRKVNIQVSSPLSLTVRVENGNVVLEFGTIPGLRYRMEERDRVDQGAWSQLGSTLVASSGTTTVNLGLPGSSQRFFRVLLEP